MLDKHSLTLYVQNRQLVFVNHNTVDTVEEQSQDKKHY